MVIRKTLVGVYFEQAKKCRPSVQSHDLCAPLFLTFILRSKWNVGRMSYYLSRLPPPPRSWSARGVVGLSCAWRTKEGSSGSRTSVADGVISLFLEAPRVIAVKSDEVLVTPMDEDREPKRKCWSQLSSSHSISVPSKHDFTTALPSFVLCCNRNSSSNR